MKTGNLRSRFLGVGLVLIMLVAIPASSVDTDRDGWADEYEEALNTDIDNPDTDGDGIMDPDDPTPKGSLVNEEEVWDTYIITITPDQPVNVMNVQATFEVEAETLSPDGTHTPVNGESLTVHVYAGSSSYYSEKLTSLSVSVSNGQGTFTYTPTNPGFYTFLGVFDTTGLTIGEYGYRSELDQMVRERRAGLASLTVYQDLYCQVDALYQNLLPNHQETLELRLWSWSPRDTTDEFFSNFTQSYYPENTLDDLYVPTAGSVYLDSNRLSTAVVEVAQGGSAHVVTMPSAEYYTWTADPYGSDTLLRLQLDSTSARVHNPLVTWYDVPGVVGFLDDGTLTANRVTLDPSKFDEPAFDQEVREKGLGKTAEANLDKSTPWTGEVWISLFYSADQYALELTQVKKSVGGHASLQWNFDAPGRYIATFKWGATEPFHPAGKFDTYSGSYSISDSYEAIYYLSCVADVVCNLHFPTGTLFTTEDAQATVTLMDGSGPRTDTVAIHKRTSTYPPGSTNTGKEVTPGASGFGTVNLGKLPRNTYLYLAVPELNARTNSMVDTFSAYAIYQTNWYVGGENSVLGSYGNGWIGARTVESRDLAVFADVPKSLVKGISTDTRVVVYGPGMQPRSGATVSFDLIYDYPERSERVGSGTTDAAGSAVVGITAPENVRSYYRLKVTVRSDTLSEVLESYINVHEKDTISASIYTNKAEYRVGETINVRVMAWKPYLMEPATEKLDLVLTDPFGREIFSEELMPDEFGVNGTDVPISAEAAWGDYYLTLRNKQKSNLETIRVPVKDYDIPQVRITLEVPSNPPSVGESVKVPLSVDYMFGAPVTEGVVDYTITGILVEQQPVDWWYYMECDCREDDAGNRASTRSAPWYWYYYRPVETEMFSSIGSLDLVEGAGEITFDISSQVTYVLVEARFHDSFDHTAEKDARIYVGSEPLAGEVEISVRSSSDNFEAGTDPDFTATVTMATDDGFEPLAGVNVYTMVEVTDMEGSSMVAYQGNLTTGSDGSISTTLDQLGVDTAGLLANGFYSYIVFCQVSDDNMVDSGSNFTFFIVNRLRYEVNTDQSVYNGGSPVTITLGVKDLLSGSYMDSSYVLGVIRNWDSKLAFLSTGTLSGSTGTVTWANPSGLPSGDYDIVVDFGRTSISPESPLEGYAESGSGYQESSGPYGQKLTPDSRVTHTISIKGDIPPKLTLSSKLDKCAPGTSVTLTANLDKAFTGYVYFDVSGSGLITGRVQLTGQTSAPFSFNCPNWRSDLEARAYLIDDSGRLVSDHIVVGLDLPLVDVTVSTDRQEYEPGENARVTVKVDNLGGGSLGRLLVALSVVDAGLFEIMEDRDELDYVTSLYKPDQQDRDHVLVGSWGDHVSFPVERDSHTYGYWPSAAYWVDPQHTIPGWSGGEGKEGVDADGGGYAGGENDSPSKPVAEDSSDRGLPGDAELDELADEDVHVRTWFTDTAFWTLGVVATSSVTTFDVRLPDNLANWRVCATVTNDNAFGSVARTNFDVSKDFFIEPVLPGVVTQDDEVVFKVRATNLGNTDIPSLTVGLSADDWLQVFDGAEQTLALPARTVKDVEFRVKVVGVNEQNLTIVASDLGANKDAVFHELRIRPNGALSTEHYAGVVEDSVSHTVDYLDEKIDESEKAVLRVVAGYEGLLEFGWRGISTFPYDSTEAVASALVSDVLLWEYYQHRGWLDYWTQKWLRRSIQDRINTLYSRVRGFGWGWHSTSQTDVWTTAFTLYALDRAQDIGFHVDQTIITNAQLYLILEANSDGSWTGEQKFEGDDLALSSYVYYVLLRSECPESAVLGKTATYLSSNWNGDEGDPYATAFYALALREDGKDTSSQVSWLVSHKTGSHWEADSSLAGSDEVTAWVSYVLVLEGNQKTEVRGALEWMSQHRLPYGGWGTIMDSIAAMTAILEVLKTSPELDMTVTVSVDDQTVKTMSVTGSNFHDFKSEMDAIDLRDFIPQDGPATVKVTKSGSGDLFYELTTVQYLRVPVDVTYPERLTAQANSLFNIDVTVDPDDSPNVDVRSIWIVPPKHDKAVMVSLSSAESEDPDGPVDFTLQYTALEAGTHVLSPFVAVYRMDAGERQSSEIRTYFGPIEIEVEGTATRAAADVDIVKSSDRDVAVAGSGIRIGLKVKRETSTVQLTIQDTVPPGFTVGETGGATLSGDTLSWTVPSGSDDWTTTYTLKASGVWNGYTSRAVALDGQDVLGVSNDLYLVATNLPYTLARGYSSMMPGLYESVEVTLELRNSGATLWHMAVEDTIPPGFEVDTNSLDDLVELDPNVISYDVSGDRVSFFVLKGDDASIVYSIVPTISGTFAVPPAKAYQADNAGETDDEPLSIREDTALSGVGTIAVDRSIGTPTVTITDIPDIALTGMEFAPTVPREGDELSIRVQVENLGEVPVTNVPIFLEINDASVGESNWDGTTSFVTFRWLAVEGEHDVKARVSILPDETQIANNVYQTVLHVEGPLADEFVILNLNVEYSPVIPREGDEITFTITVNNYGNVPAEDAELEVRTDGEQELLSTITVDAGGDAVETFTWTPEPGDHVIRVEVTHPLDTGDMENMVEVEFSVLSVDDPDYPDDGDTDDDDHPGIDDDGEEDWIGDDDDDGGIVDDDTGGDPDGDGWSGGSNGGLALGVVAMVVLVILAGLFVFAKRREKEEYLKDFSVDDKVDVSKEYAGKAGVGTSKTNWADYISEPVEKTTPDTGASSEVNGKGPGPKEETVPELKS